MISTNGIVSIFIGDSNKKAQALFSSSCNHPFKKAMIKLEAAG